VYRATELTADLPEITKSVVNHVQTSLGRAPYNIDDFGAYQAAALSVRDNLIVSPWPLLPLSQDCGSNLSLIAYVYPVFYPSKYFLFVLMQITLLFFSRRSSHYALYANLNAFEADIPQPR
jgi:hypothetical protein